MTNELVLVGRSSSHFTRVARIFALELEVGHRLAPVLDMSALAPAQYGGNPALKIPVLVDEQGPLFGTENICRALVRRAGAEARVVQRGQLNARLVANAEEMTLHAMAADVTLVMASLGGGGGGGAALDKVRASLAGALAHLDGCVDELVAALPAGRAFSFVEVALYCVVTHLPFRRVMDVGGYGRLAAFCERFGARASARATAYEFDAA
jgi:glutathione S-transferase